MAGRLPYAIIAGVGPGTGASVARKFAASYPVALLARKSQNYDPIVESINKEGGKAIGIKADVSDAASIKDAVKRAQEELGNGAEGGCAAAVFNVAGGFAIKPFLEIGEGEFAASWGANGQGAVNFSQAIIPLLLASKNLKYPPTLIFTGATASLKGSARFSSFSMGKFALRALSQSLAREFGPQGVHVAHAIIDGMIDTERTKDIAAEAEDGKISSDAIAEAYWNLHTQPRTAFTHEIDIRPYSEKW